MSIVDDAFGPIYGKPCWNFEQGYGSFLTTEFGEPHLHIVEPHQPTAEAPASVRRNAARRHIWVHGDWYLWIYLCDWRILFHGRQLADESCRRSIIKKATAELNGQALVRVSINHALVTTFDFDLGGKLKVIPNRAEYGKTSELWHLFEPSGQVLTLRADRRYSHMPGDTPPADEVWNPLPV